MPSAPSTSFKARNRQQAERIPLNQDVRFGAQSAGHPKISLRLSLALLAFFLLIFSWPAFPAEEGHYKILEVKPHVFVWLAEDILEQEGDPNFSRASNAGFVITPEGVVVINTTNTPFNARDLLYEIRQRTSLPVRFVINTSSLPDAMLGNEAFADFRPAILSTPAAAIQMNRYQSELAGRIESDWRLAENMRGIHPTPPDQTFDREMTLPIASPQIKLINLGDNISPGDAAVYLPQSKVLFLGDLFENQYIPQMASGNIRRWISELRKVESWDVDVFVPGHGEPGGRQQVEQFRHFLVWLLGQVQSGIGQHKTEQQIETAMVPFQNYHWRAPELQSKLVAAVYQQLAGDNKEASASPKSPNP